MSFGSGCARPCYSDVLLLHGHFYNSSSLQRESTSRRVPASSRSRAHPCHRRDHPPHVLPVGTFRTLHPVDMLLPASLHMEDKRRWQDKGPGRRTPVRRAGAPRRRHHRQRYHSTFKEDPREQIGFN